jgi:hypothetical protein
MFIYLRQVRLGLFGEHREAVDAVTLYDSICHKVVLQQTRMIDAHSDMFNALPNTAAREGRG